LPLNVSYDGALTFEALSELVAFCYCFYKEEFITLEIVMFLTKFPFQPCNI